MSNLLLSIALLFAMPVPSGVKADLTGSWDVKIVSTSDGEVHGVAGFTQTGDRVSGWLGPSESDPIPITVKLEADKLTIWTHPQPGRNVVFAKCEVVVDGDKMTGTIDSDKGTISFTRIYHDLPKPVRFKPSV
jgi:hypothetical protein